MSVFARFACIFLIASGSAEAEPLSEAEGFIQIESLAELDRSLKTANGKPILVRVKADWSYSSIELDKHFVSETLQNLLAGIVRIEIDVTSNTDDHRDFLSHFGIFGLPHIMFFDKRGMHIVGKDVAGYQTLRELEKHIRDALNIDAPPSSEEL